MAFSGFYVSKILIPNWLWSLRKQPCEVRLAFIPAFCHRVLSKLQHGERIPKKEQRSFLMEETEPGVGGSWGSWTLWGRAQETAQSVQRRSNSNLLRGSLESLTGHQAVPVRRGILCCLAESNSWHTLSQRFWRSQCLGGSKIWPVRVEISF